MIVCDSSSCFSQLLIAMLCFTRAWLMASFLSLISTYPRRSERTGIQASTSLLFPPCNLICSRNMLQLLFQVRILCIIIWHISRPFLRAHQHLHNPHVLKPITFLHLCLNVHIQLAVARSAANLNKVQYRSHYRWILSSVVFSILHDGF